MTPQITVLWPSPGAPPIDEIAFSYDFCRKATIRHLKELPFLFSWKEYDPLSVFAETISKIETPFLLIVTEPEIILSTTAVSCLLKCAQEGHVAAAPVFNQTAFSAQTATLSVPYLDIASFQEVAELIFQKHLGKYVEVPALDPTCILFRTDYLKVLYSQNTPSGFSDPRFQNQSRPSLAVVPGALVHRGFQRSFLSDRRDLVNLVPKGITSVLDVGCAMGGYAKTLKALRPELRITGVELNPFMAARARIHYDEMVINPVEEATFEEKFDLINCGDVLEHLQDPWAMLKNLHALLVPKGYLVLSVPNAGHWTVVRGLLKGDFEYVPLGLLCIAHLRWFTESTLCETLVEAGFTPETVERQQLPPTPKGEAFIATMCENPFADERSLRTNELVVRARKIST